MLGWLRLTESRPIKGLLRDADTRRPIWNYRLRDFGRVLIGPASSLLFAHNGRIFPALSVPRSLSAVVARVALSAAPLSECGTAWREAAASSTRSLSAPPRAGCPNLPPAGDTRRSCSPGAPSHALISLLRSHCLFWFYLRCSAAGAAWHKTLRRPRIGAVLPAVAHLRVCSGRP